MAFGKKFAREDFWVFLAALAVNSLAAWVIAGIGERATAEAVIRTRLGEDLLRGATVGRQGLICSVWFAPVPTLFLLPFLVVPWKALHVFAPHILSAAFGAWSATYLNKALHDFSIGPARPVLTLFFVLNPMVLLHSADGSSHIIFVGFMISAIHYLLRWVERGELRDLALLSLMTTLSALTHQMGGLLAAVVVAIVVVNLARKRTTWSRGEGTFFICIFPMLYAAALWHLSNWLIMGDGLYFLRGTYLGSTASVAADGGLGVSRPGLTDAMASASEMALVLSPAFTAGLLLLVIVALGRRDFSAFSLIMVALVPPVFLGIMAWMMELDAAAAGSLAAAGEARSVLLGLIPLACLFVGRLLQDIVKWLPRWRMLFETGAAVLVVALVFYNVGWNPSYTPELGQIRSAALKLPVEEPPPASLSAQVKAWVLERSERGRRFGGVKIFVCGFNGYAQFHEKVPPTKGRWRDDTVFVHVLDFDFERAVLDYHRQDLFLLVPDPRGLDAFDSIHRKFPGIYDGKNQPRLFYDSDWGNWRLFEILKAPSEDLPQELLRSTDTRTSGQSTRLVRP